MGQKIQNMRSVLGILIKNPTLGIAAASTSLLLIGMLPSLPIAPIQMVIVTIMAALWLSMAFLMAKMAVKGVTKNKLPPAKRWMMVATRSLTCAFFITMAANKLSTALHLIGIMKHGALIPAFLNIPLQVVGGIAVLFLMFQTASHFWQTHGENASTVARIAQSTHALRPATATSLRTAAPSAQSGKPQGLLGRLLKPFGIGARNQGSTGLDGEEAYDAGLPG